MHVKQTMLHAFAKILNVLLRNAYQTLGTKREMTIQIEVICQHGKLEKPTPHST